MLLVKLADRLHNMRTIRHLSPEKQQRKARETMDIYAPLAGRMGMQWMRDELEDLGFRVLNPEGRKSIIRRFVTLRRELGDVIAKITEDIRTVLEPGGRRGRGGRAGEEALFDLAQDGGEEGGLQPALRHLRLPPHHPLGRRLLHRRSAPCTSAGRRCRGGSRTISASRSRTATARSTPRSRGATASGSRCRSARPEMHAVAETGVAAHWSYRDGERFENPFAVDPFSWLRSITERFERRGGRGVPRARQARDVHRPGVLLHPQGRGGEAAAGGDADRLRLCDPYPDRRQLRRRQGRRAAGAALDQAPQRPVGDDHPRRGAAAAAVLGGHGGDRAAPRRRSGGACAASSGRRRCGSGARSRGWRWSGWARRRPTRRWRRRRGGSGSRRPRTCWRGSGRRR